MIKKILEKAGVLGLREKRVVSNEYCELVFYSKDTDAWREVLTEFLGPAAKPAGQKPTEKDIELTKSYGGVFGNQTLFKKAIRGKTVIAMFWPWQDKTHVTLKIAFIKK